MRVIIAGGRNYKLSDDDRAWLDELFALHGFKQVISGGATGADHGGEVWARSRGIELKIIKAEWAVHGRPLVRFAIERWQSKRTLLFFSQVAAERSLCEPSPRALGFKCSSGWRGFSDAQSEMPLRRKHRSEASGY